MRDSDFDTAQHKQWVRWLEELIEQPAWGRVHPLGQQFVRTLKEKLNNGFPLRHGNRQGVVLPLTSALNELLATHGISVDPAPRSVEVAPGITRKSDISWSVTGVKWVVEIKTGLEFNSLGAAVLEALAFRNREPNTKFILLSLYAKDKPGLQAEAVLLACGVEGIFERLVVLTRNDRHDRQWFESFADAINDLIDGLPVVGDASRADL